MSLLAAIGSYQIQVLGAPEQYWIMTFNAPQENTIRGIYVDYDGTLYGTGYEGSTGNRDIFLLRVSTDAQVNWQKRIDTGSEDDFASGVTADSTSIYIGASLDSTPTLTNDFYVSKHNKSNGAIVWQRVLGSSSTQSVRDIAIDSTGAVYPTGFDNLSSTMFLTCKLTSSGTQNWTRRRSVSSAAAQTYGVAIDGSDRVNVVGFSNTDEPSILQWSSNGAYLWSKRYSSFGAGFFNKVAVDSSNNIYAVGHMTVTGRANDMVIVSTDSSGTFRWARTLGSTVEDRGTSVYVTGSRIFVTGYTLQTPSSVQGAFIAEFDSLGNIVWQRTLSTSNVFTPNAIMHRGNAVWIAGQVTIDGVFQSLIAKLPDNGSSTGTYGVFQYESGVLTTSIVSEGTVGAVSTSQSTSNIVERAGTGSLVDTTISTSSLEVPPPDE